MSSLNYGENKYLTLSFQEHYLSAALLNYRTFWRCFFEGLSRFTYLCTHNLLSPRWLGKKQMVLYITSLDTIK